MSVRKKPCTMARRKNECASTTSEWILRLQANKAETVERRKRTREETVTTAPTTSREETTTSREAERTATNRKTVRRNRLR